MQAKGNVEIAASLLRSQLQRKVRPQVEVALEQQGAQSTEENVKAVSEKLTDAQIKSLTDTGVLRPNGTNFTVEAEFAAGQVLVNGQPASQLFGAILAPSPAVVASDLASGIASRSHAVAPGLAGSTQHAVAPGTVGSVISSLFYSWAHCPDRVVRAANGDRAARREAVGARSGQSKTSRVRRRRPDVLN